MKRAEIPSDGTLVDWSLPSYLVFTADPNTTLVFNFPVATHRDSAGSERVFLMARQYGAGVPDNSIRIKRSLNQGVDWTLQETVNVNGADGFPPLRDTRMVTDHIACDPRTIVTPTLVYAFYVRNETASWGRHNVLYCKASLDGGTTWNGEQVVFTISQSDLPPNGFAEVPPNGSGNTDGFYRIGRVWSSVDDNGNVYVAWMDNRYGEFGTTNRDYWHVFCARSTNQNQGVPTWSTPIRVSGTTKIKLSASIGGYGNPFNTENHIPPGDFLTCDADVDHLYVAWPDSRANQGTPDAFTRVYFRRIQF